MFKPVRAVRMKNNTLTCFSCRHVRRDPLSGIRLFRCALHKGPALHVCPDFDYEPGSDEIEANEG